jgi:hypothetical protein
MIAGAQNRVICSSGKDAYPSEDSAYAARTLLKRGDICHPRNAGRWDTLNAYPCRECEQFHLGHP